MYHVDSHSDKATAKPFSEVLNTLTNRGYHYDYTDRRLNAKVYAKELPSQRTAWVLIDCDDGTIRSVSTTHIVDGEQRHDNPISGHGKSTDEMLALVP